MKDDLIIYGRRPDSPHSPSQVATLSILHLGQWNKPVDYDAEARKLAIWLVNHLPPATMDAMDWNRDLVREVERLRDENDRLTRMLKESVHV